MFPFHARYIRYKWRRWKITEVTEYVLSEWYYEGHLTFLLVVPYSYGADPVVIGLPDSSSTCGFQPACMRFDEIHAAYKFLCVDPFLALRVPHHHYHHSIPSYRCVMCGKEVQVGRGDERDIALICS